MLKTSAKISAPVLGQNTLKLFKCRRFHLSSQSNTKTFAKSSTTLHKSIFSKQKSHNNKRWSSNSNTQAGTGLDIKTVVGHSHSSNDASPQNYDQYFSTESLTSFLAALSAGVLAALVMTLTDSDKNDELQRLAQQLQAIKNKGEGVDAETVSQALKAVHANFRLATQEQQTLFVEFAAQILQHQASPDLAAQSIDILRFALAKGIALPISASELIYKFTTDQFIQEIPVQSALVHLLHRAALNRATRPSVATPVVVDYAELLMHHSEESVATQATHILLALARSSDYIELLGGTVRSLWVLISRNEREEAVGYAKEALSLINKRQASTTNAQFKHTVETQIMQANIHRKALEHISGYTNNSFVNTILSNVFVTAAGAGWGLVRWHSRLARNPSIDTATARKLATARVVPTVVGSLVLYNLANYFRLGAPGKEGDVFEPFVVMLSGAAVTAIAPYTVVPAAAGYARTYSSRRSKFASDHDYQN